MSKQFRDFCYLVRLSFDNPKTNPIGFTPLLTPSPPFSMSVPRIRASQFQGLSVRATWPSKWSLVEKSSETDNILEMFNCTWQHKHYKQQLMASDGLEGLLYFIGDFKHYPSSLFSVGWRGTWKWGEHNSSKFRKSSIICTLNEWKPMAAWKLVSHKVHCAWFIIKQQKLALTLTWFFKHAKARVRSVPEPTLD